MYHIPSNYIIIIIINIAINIKLIIIIKPHFTKYFFTLFIIRADIILIITTTI